MKATKIGHWPGKETPCCEKHAGKMAAVGQALGMSVSFSENYDETLTCKNCDNEPKEQKEKEACVKD